MIKLSISYEEFIVALFIGPILLAALFNIVVITYRIIKKAFTKVTDYLTFSKRMKEIERRKKEEGFMHEWVTIKHSAVGEVMVCKETGFCPKLYGFFDVTWVKKFVETDNKADSIIKEREAYFEKRLGEIGNDYNMSSVIVEQIADEVLSINKEFTIQKLESLKNELKPEKL